MTRLAVALAIPLAIGRLAGDPRMKYDRDRQMIRRRATAEAGFVPLAGIELVVVLTLLTLFGVTALSAYRTVKQHGGGEWAALGTGAAFGLCADLLFVAGIYVLVRLFEWRDSKRTRAGETPENGQPPDAPKERL